jgi:hypothetical protein
VEPENLLAGKWETKTEGPFWKLYKPYGKKLLYLSLMLLLPGGFWILGLCLVAYALNWGAEVHALQEKQIENWKGEHDIHP